MSQNFDDGPSDFEQSFAPAPQQQQKSGCLGISWLLVIPVGCLGSVLLCGGCIVGIFGVAFAAIKSSAPYADSVAAAQQSPAVKDALGEPVEPGLFLQGNININNDDGEADFQIPISGPKGEGMIYVEAEMKNGKWNYSRMEVEAGGRTISLLEDDGAMEEGDGDDPD